MGWSSSLLKRIAIMSNLDLVMRNSDKMKEFVYQSVSVLSMLLSTPLCSPVMKVRLKSNDSMVKPGVVSGRTKSIVRFKF